jgi:putative flippase GtrA
MRDAAGNWDEFLRFLVGGAINTVITYVLFLALDRIFHHSLAYTFSFLAGIAIAYALASTFVFRTGFALRSALRFPGVYVVQYVYGLAALWLLIEVAHMPGEIAMLLVIVTSVPLTFLLTRFAVTGKQPRGARASE